MKYNSPKAALLSLAASLSFSVALIGYLELRSRRPIELKNVPEGLSYSTRGFVANKVYHPGRPGRSFDDKYRIVIGFEAPGGRLAVGSINNKNLFEDLEENDELELTVKSLYDETVDRKGNLLEAEFAGYRVSWVGKAGKPKWTIAKATLVSDPITDSE